jgi:hypothetical protein
MGSKQYQYSTYIVRFMRLKEQIKVLVVLALLIAVVVGQTADDDEVVAAYIGYPHTFYSGIHLDM